MGMRRGMWDGEVMGRVIDLAEFGTGTVMLSDR